MMKSLLHTILLLALHHAVFSQTKDLPDVKTDTIPVFSDTTQYNDTTVRKTKTGIDTTIEKKVHSPRKATMRSLIIPGWGQVYNKKYWKLPIVYGAIGVPVYLFFDNKKWYNRTRYALSIVANERYANADSLAKVHEQLKIFVDQKAEGSLVNYRNEFRKNMDYSILFTLLMWGLNIVDATVDAHLKDFNVSDDLSMRIKPVFMTGSMQPGLSLVLNFK